MMKEQQQRIELIQRFIQLAKHRGVTTIFPDPAELCQSRVLLLGYCLDFGLVKTILGELPTITPHSFYSTTSATYNGNNYSYTIPQTSWPKTEQFVTEMATKAFWPALKNLVKEGERITKLNLII